MSIGASILFILNIFGGLGIFLYGLKVLSTTLQKISSERLKKFFDYLTKSKLRGIALGAVVTSILQSSSASTVLMIGFANAGLIGLIQCISIVFGANVGTTITAQIIAFKASNIALPLIGVGSALLLLSKRRRWQALGEILLGLGLLFFGLKVMSSFLKPLKDVPAFTEMFVTFGRIPILGVIVGAIITALVQSSSATTGMIIAIATLGVIDFKSAFALELGSNIGTTITAQLAAFNSNITAKRAAWAHTIFNVAGSAYMLVLLYVTYNGNPIFLELVNMLTPGNAFLKENMARHIANAHTIFNITNCIILFPFIGLLAKITTKIVPDRKEKGDWEGLKLDPLMTNTPAIAIQQAVRESGTMLDMAKTMTKYTYQFVTRNKQIRVDQVQELETTLDNCQRSIVQFLSAIDNSSLSDEDQNTIIHTIDLVDHIERIGDHNQLIMRLFEELRQNGNYDRNNFGHIKELHKNIQNMFAIISAQYLDRSSQIVSEIKHLCEINEQIHSEGKAYIVNQMRSRIIAPQEGIVIIEISDRLEMIGNQLSKIARLAPNLKVV